VERLGAVAIDYHNDDFLARVRGLTGDGVDIALDGIGGPLSLRSFRALRRGGRLVVFGRYGTIAQGRKNWPGVIAWYAATGSVALWGLLSPRRKVLSYRIQKLRIHHQDWFQADFLALLEMLRRGEIHPVVAERLPLSDVRRAHELLGSTAAKGKIVLVPKPAWSPPRHYAHGPRPSSPQTREVAGRFRRARKFPATSRLAAAAAAHSRCRRATAPPSAM
jgi:NADPH2:quinone reductase